MAVEIRTENLRKTYKSGENEVVALDDVTVNIKASDMVAVTGTSGAGKSTLLHLLGSLDVPSSGTVYYGEQDIYQWKEKELAKFRCKQVGFVYQFFNLIPELSAWENIILPCTLAKEKPDKAYLENLCEELQLTDRLGHLPAELSGGQQQRVAIVRALANQPEVLLCDEPTGNLDRESTKEVMKVLNLVHEKYKQSIVIVTHDMEVASQCSRNIQISDGRIVE